jgi:hypothetical protein
VDTNPSTVVVGLFQLGLATALTVATIWVLLHATEVGERTVAMLRRYGLIAPPPVLTYEPSVERIAADLRRLGGAMRRVPRGTSHIRRKALQLAYDDALVAGCRALDVQQSLSALPLGMDRDLERIRIEAELERAGLRFRPVSARGDG